MASSGLSIKGIPELKARLRAVSQVFKPIGRDWADDVAQNYRGMVPVKTGRLRGSFRRKSATMQKAVVVGHFSAYFIDKGTVRHPITPRQGKKGLLWEQGGRTVFSKKVDHPRTAARPFRARGALDALEHHQMSDALIAEWNRAA